MGDVLFGTPSEVVQGPALDQNQQNLSNLLMQLMTGGMGNGVQEYQGQFTPNQSPESQAGVAALQQLLSRLGSMDPNAGIPNAPATNQNSDMMQSISQAITGAMNASPQDVYSQYQQSIANPLINQFKTEVLPAVREQFSGGDNFWSSARLNSENQAMDKLGQTLSQGLVGYQNDATNRALNAAQTGLGYTQLGSDMANQNFQQQLGAAQLRSQNLFNTMGMGSNLAGQLMGQGNFNSQLQQQGLGMQYQDWLRQQPENNPYLNMAMSYLGLPLTYTYMTQPTQGLLPSLFGLFGSVAPYIFGA